MSKQIRAALVVFLFVSPAAAVEPSPSEKLRHAESAIYWRERSFAMAEERRQAGIADQLAMNDVMRVRSYAYSPVGGAVYYGPFISADAAYAITPRAYAGGIFEPWPYVAGDIWGYPYVSSVRQPIGQRQLQTGPNRWESFPVYQEDLVAAPAPAPVILPPTQPAPAVDAPRLRPEGPRAF
jgi:hypothetical protein